VSAKTTTEPLACTHFCNQTTQSQTNQPLLAQSELLSLDSRNNEISQDTFQSRVVFKSLQNIKVTRRPSYR